MEYEMKELDFRLKDVLFSPLYHWRVILTVAVVLAVLLGGFRGISVWRDSTNADTVSAQNSAYEKAMQEYVSKKAMLEQNLATALSDLEAQQKYFSESVLMSLDYRNVYVTSLALYVDAHYQIMPGMAYQNTDKTPQILSAYLLALQDNQVYESAAAQAGKDAKYIRELIGLEVSEDWVLTVTIQHVDKAQAEALQNVIVEQLESIQSRIAANVADHELKMIAQDQGYCLNRELAELQEQEKETQSVISDSIDLFQAGLSELHEPANNVASAKTAVKACVKWAILGGAAGAVVMYGFYCFAFLLSGKVYSAQCIGEGCGIRVLGSIANEKRKRCGIDRWLRKREGRIGSNSDENNALLTANVKNHCPAAGKLLVCGDAPEEMLVQVTEILDKKLGGVSVVQEGSLLRSAKAVDALAQCDCVLLVECCGVSEYARVNTQISNIKSLEKPIIGCVLFD